MTTAESIIWRKEAQGTYPTSYFDNPISEVKGLTRAENIRPGMP